MLTSKVVVASQFALTIVGVVFLYRYYALANTKVDVTVTVLTSWVLGAVGILLLPYDISLSLASSGGGEDPLLGVWSSIYWATFALAWFILPIQMEYHNSGEFSALGKLRDALYKNLLFASIGMMCLLAYIVYEVITTDSATVQVEDFLMAVGNTYGILLLVVLAGSGLIGVPRRLWEMSEYEQELARVWLLAPACEEAFQEARFSLEDTEYDAVELCVAVEEAALARASSGSGDSSGKGDVSNEEILYCTAVLREAVAMFEPEGRVKRRARRNGGSGGNRSSSSSNFNFGSGAAAAGDGERMGLMMKRSLVEAHATLKKCQIKFQASYRRWRSLLEHSVTLEAALEHQEEEEEVMRVSQSSEQESSNSQCCDFNRCLGSSAPARTWLRRLKRGRLTQVGLRGMSVVALALSVIILICEVFMATDFVESPLGLLIDSYQSSSSADGGGEGYSSDPSGAGTGQQQQQQQPVPADSLEVQAVSFCALAYLAVCTFYSLFCMNIGHEYSLSGPQQSTPSSLLFNGCYAARLQFSLGYNFILMLNSQRLDATSFSALMADMRTVPVAGTSLTVYIPIITLFVFFAALFRQYQRLISFIPGFEMEGMLDRSCCYCFGSTNFAAQERSDEELETLQAGKKLVDTERRRLLGSSGSSSAGAGAGGGGGGGDSSMRGSGATVGNPMMTVHMPLPGVVGSMKVRAVELASQASGAAAGAGGGRGLHHNRHDYSHLTIPDGPDDDDNGNDHDDDDDDDDDDEEQPPQGRGGRGGSAGGQGGQGGFRVVMVEDAVFNAGRYSDL